MLQGIVVRQTRRGSLGLLLVCLALAVVGCGKQSFVEIVRQTTYLGLPTQIDYAINLDINRLRLSDNFSRVESALLANPKLGPLMRGMRERLKLDPLRAFHYVSMGAPAETTPDNLWTQSVYLVKAELGDPKEKLESLRKWLGEDFLIEPPPFKEVDHGSGFAIHQLSAQSQYNETIIYNLYFAFPAPDLMLFSMNQALLGDTLNVIAGSADGIQKSDVWAGRLARPNLGATFWSTGSMALIKQPLSQNPMAATMLRGAISEARDYFISVDTLGENKLELGYYFETSDAARKMTEEMKTGLDGVKKGLSVLAPVAPETAKLADKIVVLQELQEAKLILILQSATVRAVLDEAKAMAQPQATPTPTPTQ